MPPILYLIDGHALAYRTYFALMTEGGERFQSREGEPTAGTFGFMSVLLRILEKEKPEYLAVAFDTGKTFRNEMYPEYKATRAKMPDDLRTQIERIRQLVDAFGFPRLEKEGFEADDVIGTIARQASKQGFGVKIITGDRDLLQLVDERIIVNLPGKSLSEARDYQAADVVEKLGVRPDQVVDYKALVGDKSDNIPGVAGVGEKTAIELLKKYETLDNVYAHLDEIAKGARGRLEAGREMAYTSHQLAEITTAVPIYLELEKARVDLKDLSAVEEIFRKLDFRALIRRVKDLSGSGSVVSANETAQLSLFGEPVTRLGTSQESTIKVNIVDTPEKLTQLLEVLKNAPLISLDTETTSIDPLRAKLVGISLAVESGEGFYIPLGHLTGETQLALTEVIEALKPILGSGKKGLMGHHLKYDALVLTQHGLRPKNFVFDSLIAGFLIDPSSRHLGLKDMADELLGVTMTHIEELIGKGAKQISMAQVPVEKAAPYAAADAEMVWRLYPLLTERMKERNATRVFEELEMPLISILMDMELAGIALDLPFFKKMAIELDERVVILQQQVYDTLGYPFNLNSTQQLSKALFETLKLKPPDIRKKTSSGHFSTSADVLEQIQGQHVVIDLILEYRELSKLKSTYVDALPEQINPQTGRVHTSYNQTGSVTGRLASSDPNLQNIPTRTELGRKVRQGFVAGPGKLFLAVDYSQVELRIVAHLSEDVTMLAAFRNGEDIHAATAAAIYSVPLEKVTKDQRRNAKAINFGLIYGMSAFGLSNTTDLTLGESENFVKAYFQQFPGVKRYLDDMRLIAARQGYVETLLGRRRYFPNLKNQMNVNLRNREEREAINAPVQGTAADIIKLAMIQLPAVLKENGLHACLLLQVHDELILEIPLEELSKTASIVKDVMEHVLSLSIPLSTEARAGKNWGQLAPLLEE